MRGATAAMSLSVLLITGCTHLHTSAAAPADAPSTTAASGADVVPPGLVPDAPAPPTPTPSPLPAPSKDVSEVPASAAAPSPSAAAVPRYVPPVAATPLRPVYVPPLPAPGSNGDAVTVPVAPPCPAGTVQTSIDRVQAVPTSYQGGFGNSLTYNLTISGTVQNLTDGAVQLASFNPVSVQVGYTRAYLQGYLNDTLPAGGSATWTATATWTQYGSYDKPEVTAQALGWRWGNAVFGACPAGPLF